MSNSSIKVTVSFSRKSDGAQVYYKIDGERFTDSRTLKLHVDTTYKVSFEVRPGLAISSASIGGIKVDGAPTKTDASVCHYAGTWSSGMMPKTSSKDRSFLPILVEFEDRSSVERSIQCKMYPLKDKTHIVWGSPLKCIEIRCSKRQDGGLIHPEDVLFI